MKTLVIGGTGMVGSMVVAGLLKQGVNVRVMSHSPDKLKKLPTGVEGYRADLDDPDTLPAAFDRHRQHVPAEHRGPERDR